MKKLKKYKNFYLIVDEVVKRSSSQKLKILKYLNSADALYYTRAESFAKEFFKYLKLEKISFNYAIKAYLKLIMHLEHYHLKL